MSADLMCAMFIGVFPEQIVAERNDAKLHLIERLAEFASARQTELLLISTKA